MRPNSAMAAECADTGADSAPRARHVFNVEGMHCANCARTIERAVRALDGVHRISINPATARVSLESNPETVSLGRVFAAIRKAGFEPIPLEGSEAAAAERAERRAALKRIGVAGLGMMQTMMFVYALYAGGAHGVNAQIAQYLRVAGMLLTTPVLVYSGAPFFTAALRDLRQRRLGMDVPVSVALLLAFVASVANTFRGDGQVYYDSITMFIFLLSLGRFAEMAVRQRNLSASEAFVRSVPAHAVKVSADGSTKRVNLHAIEPGDVLLVARGAIVPVDGRLRSGNGFVDESLVTGESRPVIKTVGGEVLGGSINTGDPIEIVCTATAEASTLAGIVTLLRRAGAERPRTVAAADRAASWFSLVTLLLAAAVAAFWGFVDSGNVMTATLAVLVVTCPCALSLATPAAFAAAASRLARLGMLVVKPDAIEHLSEVSTVVLDKTGTLTEGAPVARVENIPGECSPEYALAVAAALERASNHPVAQAFARSAKAEIQAHGIRELVGRGVEGWIAGQVWRVGRYDFVSELFEQQPGGARRRDSAPAPEGGDCRVALGSRNGIIATFDIRDEVSRGAREAVDELRVQSLRVAIASGDSETAVRGAAEALGVGDHHSRMDFREKMDFVRQRQTAGEKVLMVGDGINDGPVLAAAHVSCALTDGSAVAQSAADLLLLNRSLRVLPKAIQLARKTRHIIRQNLLWALVYNVTMVPLAAAGLIAPWIAALGMSISSLAVTLNSARLAAEPSAVKTGETGS